MTEFKLGEIVKNRRGDDCEIISTNHTEDWPIIYKTIDDSEKGYKRTTKLDGSFWGDSEESTFDLISNTDNQFTTMDGYWWVIYEGELIIAESLNGSWFEAGNSSSIYIDKIGSKIEPPKIGE